MARNVSAIVSGMGFGCGFLTALDKAARKLGLGDDDIYHSLNENSPLVDQFAKLMAESCRPKLLEPVGTANIPATTGRFVAKDRFVLDTSVTAKTRISYLGDQFKAWFLDKIEEPFAPSTLRSFKLRESSLDGPIIAELGGEVRAETTLAEVYALMERQKSGESGILLTNGWANIFYVRDSTGALRAVHVLWFGGGWNLDAFAVTNPRGWNVDYQVFSRNS